MEKEIKPLTTLRLIAALLVFAYHGNFYNIFMYHYTAQYFWQSIPIEGFIGVSMFFTLSGFLITLRYYDAFTQGGLRFKSYFIKRAARIYPSYYFLLPIAIAFPVATAVTLQHSIVNLTLTQGFFADLRFSGVSTAWSLTVEESFYFVAPVIFFSIFYALRRFRWPAIPVLLSVWTIGLLIFGYIISDVSRNTGLMQIGGFMHDLDSTLFGSFFCFAVGMGCAFAYMSGRITKLWEHPRGPALATGICLIGIAGLIGIEQALNQTFGQPIAFYLNEAIGIPTGLMILALTCEKSIISRVMSWNILVYGGRISFMLYVLQGTAIPKALYNEIGLAVGVTNPIHFPLVYLAASIISAILYEIVEKPGRRIVLGLTRPRSTERTNLMTTPDGQS
jgi:peptidoglycan/LPS O-acetylase OafA/YrhL